MERSGNEVLSTLHELVETCRDSEKGFRNAAEHVKDPELKSLFDRYSRQRAQFAEELKAELHRMGGREERGDQEGSLAARLHRGWMDLRAAVGDDHAILAEAERGEDRAKAAYEEALRKDLPAELRPTLERQHRQVQEAHDTVREHRDRRKRAA